MIYWMNDVLRRAIREPREAGRLVMRSDMPRVVWFCVAGLSVMALVAFSQIGVIMIPRQGDVPALIEYFERNPLALAVTYAAVYALMVVLTLRVGAMFDGVAGVDDIISLTTMWWLVSVVVNAAELFLFVLAPALGALFALVTTVWTIWLLATWISEAHRFESVPAVIGGMFATAFIVIIFAGLVLILTGASA